MKTHTLSSSLMSRNQDLLRTSIQAIDRQAIIRALSWLNGEAAYPYPTSIQLDLTLRCTARCIHCQQWTWPDRLEFTDSQLEQLFQVFGTWGVRSVILAGGNPLISEHITRVFDFAREQDIRLGIITESADISDNLAAGIRNDVEWIRFSLDGPSSEIHDSIRNTPGLFERVMASIRHLRAIPSDLSIGLNCVIQRRNLHALDEMITLADNIGVDVLMFKLPHGEDRAHHFVPTPEEWKEVIGWIRDMSVNQSSQVRTNLTDLARLLDTVFCEGDLADGRPVRSFYTDNQIRCFTPLFSLTCDSIGNMYPCCYLQADNRPWKGKYGRMRNEFCLGNVLEDSQSVLEKLASLLRQRVHGLPASGYDECGSCTRFCQLNASMTALDEAVRSKITTPDTIDSYLKLSLSDRRENPFL